MPHLESGCDVLNSTAADSICFASPTADRPFTDWESTITGACSRKFCFNPDLPEECKRQVLTLALLLWAAQNLSAPLVSCDFACMQQEIRLQPRSTRGAQEACADNGACGLGSGMAAPCDAKLQNGRAHSVAAGQAAAR